MHSHLLKDFFRSKSSFRNFSNIGRYFKWILVGVVVIFSLIIVLLVGLIIISFQFIQNIGTAQLPNFFQEGSNIVQQGPAWFATFFPAEQAQLEGVMQQVDAVQQVIQSPNIGQLEQAAQLELAEQLQQAGQLEQAGEVGQVE